MTLFEPVVNRLRGAPQQKDSRTARISRPISGETIWGAHHSYQSRLATGFAQNAIVYRCIRMIAEACAGIPICVTENGTRLTTHPLIDLLKIPNPVQTGTDLLEDWYTFLLVHGNAYLEVVGNPTARELYVLRPERMKVIAGARGWPAGYEYSIDGRTTRFIQDEDMPPILHVKLFDPNNDHYGMSPLEAANTAIEIHNAANRWNRSLFENAARPSGALVYRGQDGAAHLTEEQFNRLKQELTDNFQGVQNAGRPLLLEGGLDWSSISLSPQDMDFIAAKHSAARDIALAFGVPPMLLGIPGDNTYSNFAEANRAFWRQTVLPLAERSLRAFSKHLASETPAIALGCNTDAVPALAEERYRLWQRLNNADFLTLDEKRAVVGYSEMPTKKEKTTA